MFSRSNIKQKMLSDVIRRYDDDFLVLSRVNPIPRPGMYRCTYFTPLLIHKSLRLWCHNAAIQFYLLFWF